MFHIVHYEIVNSYLLFLFIWGRRESYLCMCVVYVHIFTPISYKAR